MASSPAINHRSPIANSLLSTTSYPTALPRHNRFGAALHLIYINTIAATSVLLVLVKLGSFLWTPVPSNLPNPLEPKH